MHTRGATPREPRVNAAARHRGAGARRSRSRLGRRLLAEDGAAVAEFPMVAVLIIMIALMVDRKSVV